MNAPESIADLGVRLDILRALAVAALNAGQSNTRILERIAELESQQTEFEYLAYEFGQRYDNGLV